MTNTNTTTMALRFAVTRERGGWVCWVTLADERRTWTTHRTRAAAKSWGRALCGL